MMLKLWEAKGQIRLCFVTDGEERTVVISLGYLDVSDECAIIRRLCEYGIDVVD
jgi:hypothetical protein